jgi:hypothetical protein
MSDIFCLYSKDLDFPKLKLQLEMLLDLIIKTKLEMEKSLPIRTITNIRIMTEF